jgi:hypothetical protein
MTFVPFTVPSAAGCDGNPVKGWEGIGAGAAAGGMVVVAATGGCGCGAGARIGFGLTAGVAGEGDAGATEDGAGITLTGAAELSTGMGNGAGGAACDCNSGSGVAGAPTALTALLSPTALVAKAGEAHPMTIPKQESPIASRYLSFFFMGARDKPKSETIDFVRDSSKKQPKRESHKSFYAAFA